MNEVIDSALNKVFALFPMDKATVTVLKVACTEIYLQGKIDALEEVRHL